MASATTFLEQALAAHVLTGTPYTAPETIYLALYTTDVDESGSGTEVSGGSYAAQVLTMVSTGTPGEYQNEAVSFLDMPATVVSGLYIRDHLTAGNKLYYANFTPVTVIEDDPFEVEAGTLIVRHG
jgi:hypothetical protein